MTLRPIIAAAAALAFTVPAFAGTFTVELSDPLPARKNLVAEKTVWDCDGAICSAELKRKKVSVRTCKKIAKKAGTVIRFTNGKSELTAEQLEVCNTAVRN
jgi:hypothetical protein